MNLNPLDLLNTNRYVATNELNFKNDQTTRDRLNVLKTIDRPFPKRYNRNWEPVVSNSVRDVVKDRYKKYRKTAVILDSRDRNRELYPNPNCYTLVLPKQFNTIESIQITNINLTNFLLTKTDITWEYPDGDTFTASIPNGTYTTTRLQQTLTNAMNSIVNTNMGGNMIHGFHIDIDPITQTIQIINRQEAPEIYAIQTILDPQDDIFNTVPTNPGGYRSDGIFILVNSIIDFETNPSLPLIPTGLPNIGIGGFPSTLFNFVEFWFGSTTTSEYFDAGTVTINGTTYQRYFLKPRTDLSDDLFASYAENMIVSEGLARLIDNNSGLFQGVYSDRTEFNSQIGRALEYRFNFQESNLMNIFCWEVENCDYKFIWSNQDSDNISGCNCFELILTGCCEYIFKVEPYILLKLGVPSYPNDTIAQNIVKSQHLPKTSNCLAEEDECRKANNYVSNIFAKIDIDIPFKIDSSILTYIDAPLVRLNEIEVCFVDKMGCVLDLQCDNTITLEIIEIVDVLKDTLIDSRHGEANISGVRPI